MKGQLANTTTTRQANDPNPVDAIYAAHTNEADLAEYLLQTPEFFSRYGSVLADLRIPDPQAGRAISLHQRQLQVVRERVEYLQRRIGDLMGLAHENEQIADRLARWTRDLLAARDAGDVPTRVVDGLTRIFDVPQVSLRLWGVLDQYEGQSFSQAVDDRTKRMAAGLSTPYCGLKGEIEQTRWLADGGEKARSVALLALTDSSAAQTFGLIVLGSPDADRFQKGMGTEFLQRIGQTASAALARIIASEEILEKT